MKIVISESQYNRIFNESNTIDHDMSLIYNRYKPLMIHNLRKKFGLSRYDSEDFFQEGFIKFLNKFKESSDIRSIPDFMWIIIKNYTIDTLRKNKKLPLISIDKDYNRDKYTHDTIYGTARSSREFNIDPPDDSNDDIEPDIIDKLNIDKKTILDGISFLSPKYQKIFKLFYIDKLPHKEIAKKLNIDVGTSKSNLFKAKKRLYDIIVNGNKTKKIKEEEESSGDSGSSGSASNVEKWEDKVTRGPANPIDQNSKWEGQRGWENVVRGVANPL